MIRRYTCPYCSKALTHQEARKHWESLCPAKPKGGMKRP